MKTYLAPRHPDVATQTCITGNSFVGSFEDNIQVRITVIQNWLAKIPMRN